jgi:glycosyltransferase involved in cell wall biosynthesis
MTQAMTKLGIVVSHPIQYYSPLFRFLAKYVDLEVFYCFQPTAEQVGRSGFGAAVDWGIDLLGGYSHRFVENVSKNPDTDGFSGIDTPGIGEALKSAGVTHVLIMGWQLKCYWQAYIYCLRHGIPVAVRGDSQINPNESRAKSTARRLLYPLFLRRYHKIFFVGQRNKKYLLRNGAKNSQLLFAPHAVDQDFWKPVTHAPKNKNLVRFLWVAKFIPVKRPDDAILSFRMALEKRPDMELCMIGLGELLQRCQSLAAGEPRIQFLGFKNQAELRDIYASGDCLLLTSESESWGLVVNEAMSMGLPAIVSDACGCSEDLIDKQTGFTYGAGDVGSLTARILEMADLLRRDPMPSLAERNAQYSFTATLSAIKLYLQCPP